MPDTQQSNDTDQIIREYECAYLFAPTIAEEKIATHVDELKQVLTKHGATLYSEQDPKRIPLAYEMKISREGKAERYLEGYFGWVTMEATPEAVGLINEELRLDDGLIRFMIISAPKDQEPPTPEGEEGENEVLVSPQSEEEQSQSTASAEEIDKSIDELVVEDAEK